MRQQLIEDNMNLVHFLISRYYPTFIHDEDLAQTGMVGLCKAADSWREDGVKFSTFASKCILNEINTEFKRRKKHNGVLSLDYEVGENSTFKDVLVGDEDVAYVNFDEFTSMLTDEEKLVFELQTEGYSTEEIGRETGFVISKVRRLIRTIALKWRKYSGD